MSCGQLINGLHFPNLFITFFKATHTGSVGEHPDPVAQIRKSITRRPHLPPGRWGYFVSMLSASFLLRVNTPAQRAEWGAAPPPAKAGRAAPDPAGISILETREITRHVSLCPNFTMPRKSLSPSLRSGVAQVPRSPRSSESSVCLAPSPRRSRIPPTPPFRSMSSHLIGSHQIA
jgi:hypothetical protein